MKKLNVFGFFIGFLFLIITAFTKANMATYKCMVQLVNYTGEGAYVVVSLLDKNKKYIKTLRVLGKDEAWYVDILKWNVFYEEVKEDVDAISGETIAGGERTVFALGLTEEDALEGNVLRFETAVEDQKYHFNDVEIVINDDELTGDYKGSGYIRYVKLIKQ